MKINNAEMPDDEFWALVEQHGGKRPTCGKRWRAKVGEPYWWLNSGGGKPIVATESNDSIDDYHFASGNYHRTREEAEKYRDRQLATIRVLDRKIELEAEYGAGAVDWRNIEQIKHFATYNNAGGSFRVENRASSQCTSAEMFSTNVGVISRLIEEMPDDMKLMMGVE